MSIRVDLITENAEQYFLLYPSGRRAMHQLRNSPAKPRRHSSSFLADTTMAIVDWLDAHEDGVTWSQTATDAAAVLRLQTVISENNARTIARYKTEGQVPELKAELLMPLSPYQKVGAYCASNVPGYCLFMEQGTGKTATAIARIVDLHNAAPDSKLNIIITCPNNVRHNWVTELAKFCPIKHHARVLRGGLVDRTHTLLETLTTDVPIRVVICGYDSLVNTPAIVSGAVAWDLAIADESHMIKTARAKRTGAAFKLRDVTTNRLALTGTPITNGPFDLWAQLEFCEQGLSGFKSIKDFRNFFGVYTAGNTDGFKQLVGLQNVPVLRELLARHAFIISLEEAMPHLPKKLYDVVEVELTAEQQAAYDSIAINLAHEAEALESDDEGNKQMLINNLLVKLLRLAQVCSGYITWDPVIDPTTGAVLRDKIIEGFTTNPKLETCLELLAPKTAEHKTLIWCAFNYDVSRLAERLPAESFVTFTGATSEADRLDAERRFNEDLSCKYFIGNPHAGGAGLNLLGYSPNRCREILQAHRLPCEDLSMAAIRRAAEQIGGADGHRLYEAGIANADHVIYYSSDWSAVARSQSEARANRRGTRVPTRITDLVVPASIDEMIRARVLGKIVAAMELKDIREFLAGFLHAA